MEQMDVPQIILSFFLLIVFISALVSAIRKGIKYKWPGNRVAGLIVAIICAPLYWIIYAFDGFKNQSSPEGDI